jgi:ABC-2 type transport system ATP-binding protein
MERSDAVWADGLEKTYRGGVRALDGMGFAVEPGTVFALLGPNGAGKSTTIRILTTLTRPDAGRALVAGIDVLRDPARVRQCIGVVTQESGSILHLTGRENLTLQGRIFGLGGRTLRDRIDGLLGEFDLLDAADRVVRGYSGGMRRRLDITLGLIHRPRLLFLDEPTTGLDPEARVLTWKALANVASPGDLTVVLTTHYLEEADQFAARLAIVDRGRVVAEGTPDELKRGLEGDAIRVELTSPAAAAEAGAVLAGGDLGVVVTGSTVVARAADGARALPGLLASLDARAVGVVSVAVARPSLDDVYLHFAGRSWRAAEAGAEAAADAGASEVAA